MERYAFRAMGTDIELLVDAEEADRALAAAAAEFERLEELLSRFRETSELTRLNRSGSIDASPDLRRIVELALEARTRTNGRFDPTVHDAMLSAGYDRTFSEVVPDAPEHAGTAVPAGGDVRLVGSHITLEEGVRIDLGGIGKGYAAERAAELWRELTRAGVRLRDFDAGGGLGIPYDGGPAPDFRAYARALAEIAHRLDATLILEPGRHLAGPVGTFVTRVLHVKQAGDKTIIVCDGGMNDLLRPVLYGAEHPVSLLGENEPHKRQQASVDLVGPLCESSDFLALARTLPLPRRGDLLAIGLAGAYGRVMSSAYNARPLCAEVVLEQGAWRISRERGTYEDLVRNERG